MFSPSIFASVHYYRCEKQLYLSSTTPKSKDQQPAHTMSHLSKATTSRGFDFEARVLESLMSAPHSTVWDLTNAPKTQCFVTTFLQLNTTDPVRASNGSVVFRLGDGYVWSPTDERARLYVYQPVILPSSYLEDVLHLTGVAKLSRAIMDLIVLQYDAVTSVLTWTLVDMKATSHIKTSHELQVGVYGLMVNSMLQRNDEGQAMHHSLRNTAEIWLPTKASSPCPYDISSFDLLAA
eukprot:PhF_6_TR12592/c1_g1_i4/m.19838